MAPATAPLVPAALGAKPPVSAVLQAKPVPPLAVVPMPAPADQSVAQVALPIAVVIAVPTPKAMPATVGSAGMCALPGKHVSVVLVPVARTGIVPVGKAVVVACASTSKRTLTTAVLVGLPVSRLNIAAMASAFLTARIKAGRVVQTVTVAQASAAAAYLRPAAIPGKFVSGAYARDSKRSAIPAQRRHLQYRPASRSSQ